jgi:hypothetical protein
MTISWGYKSAGSFDKTYGFLKTLQSNDIYTGVKGYGIMGMDALSNATPRETGETATSWRYNVERNKDRITIYWYNTHVNEGRQIAVLIQYGHGTGTGGYVRGIDYINPAIRPVFDKILDDVWEKVRSA